MTGPDKHPPPGLPLFGVIAPGALYRSGQPTEEGFRQAVRLGVRTVLSLRAEAADMPPLGLPITLLRVEWQDERAPSLEVAEGVLAFAADAARRPLLVHCGAGRGRSSVACALIRWQMEGWPAERIFEEIHLYRRLFGIIRLPLAAEQRRFLEKWFEDHPHVS